ncbi:MAG: hypothetical protein ACKOFB_06995, partial [bacterium]
MRHLFLFLFFTLVFSSKAVVFAQVDTLSNGLLDREEVSLIKMKGEEGLTYVGTIIQRTDKEIIL